MASVFESVPSEILEHIAFFTAVVNPVGPPTHLVPLLLVCRSFASLLSSSSNPHVYARIFVAKFDAEAYIRRLDPEHTSAIDLTTELKRRCRLLRRFRSMKHCFVQQSSPEETALTQEMLYVAYLMMLENDGLNERQLREYANLDAWLKNFWFDPEGASCATYAIRDNLWPPDMEYSVLGMWLFWFLLRPEDYSALDDSTFRSVISILKLIALGAHKYPICLPDWVNFLPESSRHSTPISFGFYPSLVVPPLAAPAILSYLTLAPKSVNAADTFQNSPLIPSQVSGSVKMSGEWEVEWKRCLSLAERRAANTREVLPAKAFKLGSMEGIWEGLFTYTEFTAYAALLSGAPPPTLHRSLVARHQQTWKLREYHLLAPEDTTYQAQVLRSSCDEAASTLSDGDPLRAYLPRGVDIRFMSKGISVHEPGKSPLFYERSRAPEAIDEDYEKRAREIIVTGEGHSAWGQFNLIGRIRPHDGFVSLSKEYLDGDRGKWLYRGYLVGDRYGSLTGRWRDTLSPPTVPGYEGCFFMGRRR